MGKEPRTVVPPGGAMIALPSLLLQAGTTKFSAWDGQVPGEAPLPAQQLAGIARNCLSCSAHCTRTSQDGQLWPCRCWEEGVKEICSS